MIILPSHSGLSPKFNTLLAYPAQLLARHDSPTGVALICEGIASGLLLASQTAPEGDVLGSEDLVDAARWFARASTTLRGAVQ